MTIADSPTSVARFERQVELPVSAAEAFAWHERKDCFKRLLPPWENVQISSAPRSLADGEQAVLRCSVGPIGFPWRLEHFAYRSGQQFCDRQISGPFARYQHEHIFSPINEASCVLVDRIHYRLPFHSFSNPLVGKLVSARLARLFRYRHRITKQDLDFAQRYPAPKKCFLVTGANGMIGGALSAFLRALGHTVVKVQRTSDPSDPECVVWDGRSPLSGIPSEKIDVVVNFAGANIAGARWSTHRKTELVESRVGYTERLVSGLSTLGFRPDTFVSMSGAGYYGDRSLPPASEEVVKGSSFLADLCERWEMAALTAEQKLGSRVVLCRLAPVLSLAGGMLGKMYIPFSFGGGAILGSGAQQQSWVALDDVLESIYFCSLRDDVSGPVNVSGGVASHSEFCHTLARILRRPLLLRVPESILKKVLRELADEALLSNAAIEPQKLLSKGFTPRFRDLENALNALLGKS